MSSRVVYFHQCRICTDDGSESVLAENGHAMGLLDERWTILVIRELLTGSTHFNELRRGNPKMSPALLSTRLRTLERACVIERWVDGAPTAYVLTPSGEELRPAVEALATWGVRWIPELGDQDLDPHLLMWDIRRTIPIDAWPRARTVVALKFDDISPKQARWRLCVNADEADVCDFDPGYDVDATLTTSLRTMIEIWRGDRSWLQAMHLGPLAVSGTSTVTLKLPQLLGQMPTAAVPRQG